MPKLPTLLALLALALAAPSTASADVRSDFDGDGHEDLAIGAPLDSVAGREDAGAVNVLYGSPRGLRSRGDQQFTQASPGVAGVPERSDRFGAALAAGDFDGDGFSDLAVGAPGETLAGRRNAGGVVVLYGSRSGLRPRGGMWRQDTWGIQGRTEAEDAFGAALAAGDFDGDGRDDLAVGAPREGVNGHAVAGAVNVLYGSPGGVSRTDALLTLDTPGVKGRAAPFFRFGFALAAGDVSRNGRDDLAVGIPGARIAGARSAGAVSVFYGRRGGLSRVDQLWSQGARGIRGEPEAGDGFGRSLAIGDVDADGAGDLVAGVPFEDAGGIRDAGAVAVLHGSVHGLRPGGDDLWTRTTPGIDGSPAEQDYWGMRVAAGDVDADGAADVVVGAPQDDVAGRTDAGAVSVIRSGLRSRLFHQGWARIAGRPGDFDDFGSALVLADFDADGAADLAVGAPRDRVGRSHNGGVVNVLYGAAGRGLGPAGDQLWTQGSAGVLGAVGNDWFGLALGR